MISTLPLTSNMEDYLETIYAFTRVNGFARIGEIAKKMNVKSSSVNSAVTILKEQGLVLHERYGYVGLTKEGERIANAVQRKHDIVFRFLTEFLLLDADQAEQEACAIEHAISKETFLRMSKFFDFLQHDLDRKRPKITELFEQYLKTGQKITCDGEKR